MTATCLTLAFAGLASSIALGFDCPLFGRMANAAAFSGVGWMTLQLRQRAHVLEPALGAASAVLLTGVLQIALLPALLRAVELEQLGLLILISAACAFTLAWFGALLASGGRDRIPAAGPAEPAAAPAEREPSRARLTVTAPVRLEP